MLIAQITDTHVKAAGRLAYRRVDSAQKLRNCVAHLNALDPRPDIVLLTGDLVDLGRPEEYELLREILAPLAMPLYAIPGNHDERGALRRAFADQKYLPQDGEFLHYTLDDYPLRLIGLDTVVPGEQRGELCARRLAWLDAELARAPDRPTVLFMHHPPFLTGLANMDWQNCHNGDALGALLQRSPAGVPHPVRARPPADPSALVRRDREHRAEPVAFVRLRPERRRFPRFRSRAPDLRAPLLARGRRAGQPPHLHRRLRRTVSLL